MIRRVSDRWGVFGAMLAVLVSLGTIVTMAWGVVSKINRWDQACNQTDKIVPLVYRNSSDIQIERITGQNHYDDIMRHLVRIENKIDRQTP
jgi:hypothetical protein